MAMIDEQLATLQEGLQELRRELRKLTETSGSGLNKRPLTVPEIAKYLQLGESTTYRKLEQGVIPGHKVGRRWYCFEEDLRQFLRVRRSTSKEDIECEAVQRVVFGSIGGSRPFQRTVGKVRSSTMGSPNSSHSQDQSKQ
jgi:excisionase family DNA binding protein